MNYWQIFLVRPLEITAMYARSEKSDTVEGSKDFWYFDVQEDYL